VGVPGAALGPQLWGLLLRVLAAALILALTIAAIVWGRVRRAPPRGGEEPVRAEPRARRFLRLSFALLWIADGLLQAQPRMPAGFLGTVREETSGAAWLADVLDPLARAWTRHPVVADAAAVCVQVGLGLLLLVARRGPLARAVAWAVMGWSLVVWGLGEGLGGLLHPGATWASGAPGAVVVYGIAAALLLLPWQGWTSGRAPLLARRAAAGFLGIAAVLQALPSEGAWTAAGASAPFAAGAAQTQPVVFAWPFETLAGAASRHPGLVNGITVALVAAAAAGLWWSGRRTVVVAALVLCGATWWLAQDFGVLGGLATDPDTALPLGLLIASALPGWRTGDPVPAAAWWQDRAGAGAARVAAAAGVTAFAMVLALLVPLALAGMLPGPADSSALAANSEGGLRTIPPRPMPSFELTDQRGRRVSASSLRGKLVLVTFLDPVCSSDCPLIAAQLAGADRHLGALRDQVEIVAIDTNPVFTQVADVAAFTDSHGLSDLPNWHFACGPPGRVSDVLAEFGIAVTVPAVGMIEHSEAIYFITPDGREAAYLADGADEQIGAAYSRAIVDEIRSLS